MRPEQQRQEDQRRDVERQEEYRHDEPVNRTPVTDRDSADEMGTYRRRFEELQARFIEEPKETVKKAEALVEEAVERMVNSLHDRVNRIHTEMGDGTDDTERLRMAMRRYRQLMDSFGEYRAA